MYLPGTVAILEYGVAAVVRVRCTISGTEAHVVCIGEEFDLPALNGRDRTFC
jgi:hypothetical protein